MGSAKKATKKRMGAVKKKIEYPKLYKSAWGERKAKTNLEGILEGGVQNPFSSNQLLSKMTRIPQIA